MVDSVVNAAISSTERTRFTSRRMTNLPFTLPTPAMNSERRLLPKAGAGSMSRSPMSSTSLTLSTMIPSTHSSSPEVTSRITVQVRRVTSVRARPKRMDRSMTGTTAPRRLMTPRMKEGMRGTSVRAVCWITSLMERMSMAKVSPPREKARYWFRCSAWTVATAAWRLLSFISSTMSISCGREGKRGGSSRHCGRGLDQLGHVEDQGHVAGAQDRGAADALHLAEEAPQGLDDGLELAVELVH